MAILMLIELPGIYTVAVLFTLLAAFEASIPSILNSIAMEANNAGGEINYGFARGMGSVGYAIFSLFKKYSCLKYFLPASVLLFMSHNMVCVFLPMIIENAGGDSSKLGIALAISTMVEFPVMSYFLKLSQKIKTEKLLVISAIFFTIKSGVALAASSVGAVYLAQLLQFGGFALFTPASVYFINMALEEEDRNVGQAMLGACSLGLGGTFGNVLGGMLLEKAGLSVMLTVSTVFCMAAILLMMFSRKSYLKTNLKKV